MRTFSLSINKIKFNLTGAKVYLNRNELLDEKGKNRLLQQRNVHHIKTVHSSIFFINLWLAQHQLKIRHTDEQK